MKMKKLLKLILLFPAMLMLGNLEGLDAAASEDDDQDADLGGNLGEEGEEGADAPDEETDPDADPEEADAEQPDKKDEEENKGIKQKSFEERLKEIEEKNEAKIAEAIQKLQQQTTERVEAEKKPFVDLTAAQVDQLNGNYLDIIAHKADLEEAIRAGDRSMETVTALRAAEKFIHDTETWYADNEAKKAEWTEKQGQSAKLQAEAKERSDRLATAADVFREASNIPQDVWDQASVWFESQLKANKILGLEFADAYRLKGDMGAVKFAHDYCNEHMGKEAEAVLKQKQEAKTKLAPGVTGSNGKTAEADMKTLRELHAKAQKSGTEEDFLAFTNLKTKLGIKGSMNSKR